MDLKNLHKRCANKYKKIYKNIKKGSTYFLLSILFILLPTLSFYSFLFLSTTDIYSLEQLFEKLIIVNYLLFFGYIFVLVLAGLTKTLLKKEQEIFRYRIFREVEQFILSDKNKLTYAWYAIFISIFIFLVVSYLLKSPLFVNSFRLTYAFVSPFYIMIYVIESLFSNYQERLSLEKIIENELNYLKVYVRKTSTIHKKLSKRKLSCNEFDSYLTELNLSIYYLATYLSQWIAEYSALPYDIDIHGILKEKFSSSVIYGKTKSFVKLLENIEGCVKKKSQDCLFMVITETIKDNKKYKDLFSKMNIEEKNVQMKRILYETLMLILAFVASIGITYREIISFFLILLANIDGVSIFNLLELTGFSFYLFLIFIFYYKIMQLLNQIAFTKKLKRFRRK